jgi:hypothetical protein
MDATAAAGPQVPGGALQILQTSSRPWAIVGDCEGLDGGGVVTVISRQARRTPGRLRSQGGRGQGVGQLQILRVVAPP